MSNRRKRTRTQDSTTSTTTDSDSGRINNTTISSLEAASAVLHQAFDNPRVSYKALAQSQEYLPTLQYAALQVHRFVDRPKDVIRELLKSAATQQPSSIVEEMFIIEIFILFGIDYSDDIASEVSTVYPKFTQELAYAQSKAKDLKFLEGATPKPRGARKVDDSLPDKTLISIYRRSELEFWTLMQEFNRYSAIHTLIQALASDKKLKFPTDFLITQFRGSNEALHQFETYIQNFFVNFFSDSRWFSFVGGTPRLMKFLITDVIAGLKIEEINMCGQLYVGILQTFFDGIYLGDLEVKSFIDFTSLTGDENFINVIDSNEKIADQFKQLFLAHFEDLFADEKWCKFIDESPMIIKFIVDELYPSLTVERKLLCPGFNSRLLDNLLLDANIEHIITFLVGLPSAFMIQQFRSQDSIACQFRNIFSIDFDNFITSNRLVDFIKNDDELLEIVIREVIPISETKQIDICRNLFEVFLERKINRSTTSLQSLSDFVNELLECVPTDFLAFNNLNSAMQITLFQHVSDRLSPNELTKHKKLYVDFYKPFLKSHANTTMLPETLKIPFFQTIVLPYISTNTLALTPLQVFDLCTVLVDDPFADQEHCEFLNFIIKSSDELLPLIAHDDKLLTYCYQFIVRNEKDLVAKVQKEFVFQISIIIITSRQITDPRIFNLMVATFMPEIYENKISEETKAHLIFKLSQVYDRSMEALVADKTTMKDFTDAAGAVLNLISDDMSFVKHVGLVISRENRGFLTVLMSIFETENGWRSLIKSSDIFIQFVETSLEVYPTQTKSKVFTREHYDDLFSFFTRFSVQIANFDLIRAAFLQYFLANERKLPLFLACVPQPLHRSAFFTEFSDASKNPVLTTIFQTYIDMYPEEQSVVHLFNFYVTVMNQQFVHLKNHLVVIDKIQQAFLVPNQSDFDMMFPRSRLEDLQIALYKMSRAIGLDSFMDFLRTFRTLEPGPNNCFPELTEDILLRYTPASRFDTPEPLKQWETEHPRYRMIVETAPKYIELTQGILTFAIVFYSCCIAMSTSETAPVVCAVLAAITAAVLSLAPLYFSALNEHGYTAWFWVQLVLAAVTFALTCADFGIIGNIGVNSILLLIVTAFAAVTVYKAILYLGPIERETLIKKKEKDENEVEGEKKGKEKPEKLDKPEKPIPIK